MKPEEKQLLTNAILGYLPYKLKVRYYDMEDGRNEDGYIEGVSFYRTETTFDVDQYSIKAEGLKPYLRPMESMTEEERDKLRKLLWFGYPSDDYDINAHRGIEIASVLHDNWKNAEFDFEEFNDLQDFLNSIHIDYRGLIPMGLALPAPEGMYNTKTE